MNTERYQLRRRLLEFLYDTRLPLVENLKQTRQVCLGGVSPYHLEDSVWTHTMLAMQTALDNSKFTLADILCALVHDFGKPDTAQTKQEKDKPARISFYNHGPRGTQIALDFLLDYQSEFNNIALQEIANIVFCVSNHIEFYNLTTSDSAFIFCNYRMSLLTMMSRLAY